MLDKTGSTALKAARERDQRMATHIQAPPYQSQKLRTQYPGFVPDDLEGCITLHVKAVEVMVCMWMVSFEKRGELIQRSYKARARGLREH